MTTSPHCNLIGGEWRAPSSLTADINPSNTDETVGEFASATAGDVAAAIDAARAAFPAWSRVTAQQRADVLTLAGDELLARRTELGELLAREEGKTLAEGVGEVVRAGQIFRFFAGEALRLRGERLPPLRPGVDVDVTREPVGVVGVITPWNFPIAIPAWKIAPALAFGNCVIFKPADLTPACGWALVEILARAGAPDGVVSLVMGRGSVVGPALIDRVDALSFTGSVPSGRTIAAQGIGRMLKMQLEMGGKNPLVILDDADLDTAVECAINGAFFQTGQRCTASSRLIVTKGIHDRFVAAVAERLPALRVGNALAPETQIGPVASSAQLESNLAFVERARADGARILGGERLKRDTPGHYMSPALATHTRNDMAINREEVFGPVASVVLADDYDQALAIANDTNFGLSAGICTTSLKHARDFQRNAQAGLVMVNLPTAGLDYHAPFGGRKDSSFGPREQGSYAAEFYTTVKTAYVSG